MATNLDNGLLGAGLPNRHDDDKLLAEVIAQLLADGDEAMVARLIMEDLKDLTSLADSQRQEIAAHITAQLFEEA